MSAERCPIERRVGLDAIPSDLQSRLTKRQHETLGRIKRAGWSIQFVRRSLYEDQVIVLVDGTGEQHAILQEDGKLIHNPGLAFR